MIKTKKIVGIPFLLIMLILSPILIYIYFALTGNTFQKFTDVVNEFTAIHESNKSAERDMFYIFSVAGSIIYVIQYLINKKNGSYFTDSKKSVDYKMSILIMLIIASTFYFVYQGVNVLVFSGVLVWVMSFLVARKQHIVQSVVALFVNSYALSGLYRLYVFCGGDKEINITTVALIAFFLCVFLLFAERKYRNVLKREVMVAQLVIPFTLLVYVASEYMYSGELKHIEIPVIILFLMIALILLFIIEAILSLKKNWYVESGNLDGIITFGSLVSVIAFNRFSGTGAIIPVDLHHPFENIIGYSQIFELHQKVFSDYIPISGMYSVVQGFFLHFFGNDKFANYYVTQNIFYLVFILVIVGLLKKQLNTMTSFLVALLFLFEDYNRFVLIVPIMLLLSSKKLIDNKNLWLKVWYITSFIHALYYPVFGAAVSFAFLPLGIWQIVTYIKSGDLKIDIKKVSFWVWWIVCSIPVLLGMPLIFGTIRNIKAMSNQTIFADGITRFGQVIPDNFLGYLPSLPLRLLIYYICSYLIIICIIWVSVAMFLNLGRVHIQEGKIRLDNPVAGFTSLSFGLAMLVSISYTVVRMDVGKIYVRGDGMVIASAVMMLVVANKYIDSRILKGYIVSFAIFIISIVPLQGFFSIDSSIKFSPYYTVPDGYVFIENDQVDKLGTCFVEQNVYNTIENTYTGMLQKDGKKSYLGIVSDFGLYYLCNIKGNGLMEIYTIKGFDVTQEAIDLARKQDAIIGANISSLNNYYLYHWVVTSGEYVWSDKSLSFESNKSGMTKEEILERNKNILLAEDNLALGKTASSWGESMSSLSKIFKSTNSKYSASVNNNILSINFDNDFNGEEADFVYLEFNNKNNNYEYTLFDFTNSYVLNDKDLGIVKYLTKKEYNRGETVVLTWSSEDGTSHSMNCAMSHGKLLVPLGSGRGWLLNKHVYLNISVQDAEGKVIEFPELKSVEFLKLREVK